MAGMKTRCSGFSLVQTARTLIREPDFCKVESRLVAEFRVRKEMSLAAVRIATPAWPTLAEGEEMRCPLRDGEEHFLKAAARVSGFWPT